uniref:Uncharacterized protein n=1 Tax=Setaria italica TaxID=4555 RepID=K4ANW3_SETIT
MPSLDDDLAEEKHEWACAVALLTASKWPTAPLSFAAAAALLRWRLDTTNAHLLHCIKILSS